MKSFVTAFALSVATLLVVTSAGLAQLPGPGNIDWQEVWVLRPPATPDPSNPYFWMYGNRTYTGLAYDKWNDVVYVVNPGTCYQGSIPYDCVRVWALDAETGDIATRIDPPNAPPGQLYVDPSVVQGSFGRGKYALYRIDLDDQGRIYGANVVAPIFGVCYPGPPPQCDPDFLSQGPFKIYRWDTPVSDPELIYKTLGSGPTNTSMPWTMWGTSFDVVGKEHTVGGKTYDSTRIYASGGKFYTGFTTINNEIYCFIADTSASAPMPFQHGLRLVDSRQGSGFAAHGIAATGPWPHSPIWTDSNFGQVELHEQVQTNAPFPQTYQLSGPIDSLPPSVTGNSGAIAYFLDERWNRPYLIVADGLPSSTSFGTPNYNTSARVVDLATGPTWQNWPAGKTPAIGNTLFNNLTGIDNWITDVDYKIWYNDIPGHQFEGWPYLQVFVLMSNNGIACYRVRDPSWPVELSAFSADLSDQSVHLSWLTASESNNHGFYIERSFNGGTSWESLGFVNGAGSTTMAQEYAFEDPLTDVHRNIGIVHYRLRQVDFDGALEYSPVVEVLTAAPPESVALLQNFPNPFRGETRISYQLPEDEYVTLRVFNTLGMEVATLERGNRKAGVHHTAFNSGTLPPGAYIYRLETSTTTVQRKMIVSE